MSTLHERLIEAIDQAAELAGAVIDAGIGDSPWVVEYLETTQRITNSRAFIIAETSVGSPLPGNHALWAPEPEHIARWDPATVLRGLAEDRDILTRHVPVHEAPYRTPKCRHDSTNGVTYIVSWPCPEVLSLARRLGVSVDGD